MRDRFLIILSSVVLASLILFSFSSCKNSQEDISEKKIETPTNTIEKNYPEFQGSMTFTAEATSDIAGDVLIFYDFTAARVDLAFAKNKFRMIEHGGQSNGNILLFSDTKTVYHLDTIDNTAYKGEYSDLDNASELIKSQMPDHYSPTFEDLHQTETISGFLCSKYKILRSGFIRHNTEVTIWATDAFVYPHVRFDIQTDRNKVVVPMPLLIGFRNGAVLKMEIQDADLKVVYTASNIIQQVDSSLFIIPANYTIE